MRNAWLLIAPSAALGVLSPLIDAHARVRPVRVVERNSPSLDGVDLGDVRGALLVTGAEHAPHAVLTAPFVNDRGARIPVGTVPWIDDIGLTRFVNAAVEVHQRSSRTEPLALLGEWDPHVRRMVVRAQQILSKRGDASLVTLCWTADRLIRRDLLEGLGHGLAAAVYFGHGRPYGWCGYHGLHTRHLQYLTGRPLGGVLSLTCNTAQRGDKPQSFAEELITRGIAPAVLAAVTPTRTLGNWWWATRVCQVLRAMPDITLGELTVAALPPKENFYRPYRLLGDPLTPLRGAEGAVKRCSSVYAPAPDEMPRALVSA
jgi:Peptidase family C25